MVVFQEWGQSGDLYNLGMLWHVPTAAETSFATVILREFVCAEFDSIEQHINNTRTLTRSDTGIGGFSFFHHSDNNFPFSALTLLVG